MAKKTSQQKPLETFVEGLTIPANREGGFLKIGTTLGSERRVVGIKDDFKFIDDNKREHEYMGLIRTDDKTRGVGITGLFAYSRNPNPNEWKWLEGSKSEDAILIEDETVEAQLVSLLSQIFGEDWDGKEKPEAEADTLRVIGMREGRFGPEYAYAVV